MHGNRGPLEGIRYSYTENKILRSNNMVDTGHDVCLQAKPYIVNMHHTTTGFH